MKRHVQELIYFFVFVAFAFAALTRYYPYLWIASCALGMAIVMVLFKLLFIMHHDLHRISRKIDAEKRQRDSAG